MVSVSGLMGSLLGGRVHFLRAINKAEGVCINISLIINGLIEKCGEMSSCERRNINISSERKEEIFDGSIQNERRVIFHYWTRTADSVILNCLPFQ